MPIEENPNASSKLWLLLEGYDGVAADCASIFEPSLSLFCFFILSAYSCPATAYGLGHVSIDPRRGEDRNSTIIEVGTNAGIRDFVWISVSAFARMLGRLSNGERQEREKAKKSRNLKQMLKW
jgi:hypothetical protein